jgi:predicted nucleotidyltransferase
MAKLNIEPKHLQIVKDILANHCFGEEVWAYGSRVKFTNQKYSDLDLVIVSDKKQSLLKIAEINEAFEESNLPFKVDFLDYCGLAEHLKIEIEKQYVPLSELD